MVLKKNCVSLRFKAFCQFLYSSRIVAEMLLQYVDLMLLLCGHAEGNPFLIIIKKGGQERVQAVVFPLKTHKHAQSTRTKNTLEPK